MACNYNEENPRVWIVNLGKYNEGELVGDWIDLPCTKEELDQLLKDIGINSEYEEWAIFDDEYFEPIYQVHETSNIEELNHIAECILELNNERDKEILAAISDMYPDFDDAWQKFQYGNYYFYDTKDLYKIGEEMFYEYYGDVIKDTGLENVMCYFNFEDYARASLVGATETEHGYLWIN